MKKILPICASYSLLLQFVITPISYAKTDNKNRKEVTKKNNYNIKELVFPSEVKGLAKSGGSIFYSTAVKDKVLIPIHFWGEISKSGLHFMPVDTNLIQGLSMAGGPKSTADLEELTITRAINGKLIVTKYDLEDGGNAEAHGLKLQPGDTVFLKKSDFSINRSYYTSLISVFATILSSVLLYRQVRK